MSLEPKPKMFLALKLGDRSNVIVGELLSESPTEVVLFFPILINMYADDNGSLSVATSKYFMFSENDKIAILKTQIASVTKPRQELIQFYLDFVDKYHDKINNGLEHEVLNIGSSQAPDEQEAFAQDTEVPKGTVLH